MTQRRKALITGITGQEGSHLAELSAVKGYEVHGLIRGESTAKTHGIDSATVLGWRPQTPTHELARLMAGPDNAELAA